MRKECYSCGKIGDGSETKTGVFVCFNCQYVDDQVGVEDRQEQLDRLGKAGVDDINEGRNVTER
jgi:hypothetical protein